MFIWKVLCEALYLEIPQNILSGNKGCVYMYICMTRLMRINQHVYVRVCDELKLSVFIL